MFALSAALIAAGGWLIWKALAEIRAALTLPNGRGALT